MVRGIFHQSHRHQWARIWGPYIVALALLAGCSQTNNAHEEGPAAPADPQTELSFGQNNDVSASAIRDGHRVQGALAQFYRWFLFYDSDEALLQNQLDILAESPTFVSGSRQASGHQAYAARAVKVPEGWDNAHFVRHVAVRFAEEEDIRLEADIIYLNRGALEQNAIHSSTLQFQSTIGADNTALLPKIKKISVQNKNDGRASDFRPSYAENRLKSLLHYWLYLVETPSEDPDRFDDILSEEFKLNFPKTRITSKDGLREWLAGPASAAEAMHYRVRDFSFEVLGTNEYGMTAELDWYGLMENGEQLTGRVTHEFAVIDEPAEPFAMITSIRENEIVPGTLRPDDADG